MGIIDTIVEKVAERVLEELTKTDTTQTTQATDTTQTTQATDTTQTTETTQATDTTQTTGTTQATGQSDGTKIEELLKEIKELKESNFNLANYGNTAGKEISLEEEIDNMFNPKEDK